jgi:beta-lactamase superfamily II metal-dependent hydrolase
MNGRPSVRVLLGALTAALLIASCQGIPVDPTTTPEPTAPAGVAARLVVHFIDVGQGDATLITASTGERLLIDGGRSRSLIRERLRTLGVANLDAVVATHADADHLAGLLEVLDMYRVKRIYYHAELRTTVTYHNFVRAAQAERAQIIDPRRGDQILLGDLALAVLNPAPTLRGESNADSIVLKLSCGAVDILLLADAEAPSEQDMLAAGVVGDVEVLKVGHHGSKTGTTQPFLAAATPEHAVISAGVGNSYGHPHHDVMQALQRIGAAIVMTDTDRSTDETVRLESDCVSYSLSR